MPFASRFAAARKLVRVEDSDAIMLGRPDAGGASIVRSRALVDGLRARDVIVRLLNSLWETLDVEFVLGSEARNGTFRKVA